MNCDYCHVEKPLEAHAGRMACTECRKGKETYAESFYFDKHTFVPARLAAELLQHHKFFSPDGQRLYEYREELGIYLESEAHARQLIQERLGTLNSRTRSAETLFYLMNEAYAPDRVKEPPVSFIPFMNVVYDLNTRETRGYSPDWFFTGKLAAEYDSHLHDAYPPTCPAIHEFLGQVMNEENRELFYQFAGYCLYRDYPLAKAVMCVGTGSNGKSTALNVLEAMLGRANISSVELQDLTESRFAASQLHRKYANILADLNRTALKETGRFKMLTGGDTLNAEEKYKNAMPFRNYAKLIFSANTVPTTYDDTDAFFRRWIIIPFERQFTETNEIPKPALLAKLTTQEELNGLAMEGLRRLPGLLEAGRFKTTSSMEKMREDYVKASDPVGAFIMDCVVEAPENPDAIVPKDELYRAYVRYCIDRQLPRKEKQGFGKALMAKTGWRDGQKTIGELAHVHCWMGITLSIPSSG